FGAERQVADIVAGPEAAGSRPWRGGRIMARAGGAREARGAWRAEVVSATVGRARMRRPVCGKQRTSDGDERWAEGTRRSRRRRGTGRGGGGSLFAPWI